MNMRKSTLFSTVLTSVLISSSSQNPEVTEITKELQEVALGMNSSNRYNGFSVRGVLDLD